MTPLSDLQKTSIIKRIDFIELELKDLEQYENMSYEIYSRDRKARRDVERLSENIANATIDIGKIILAGENVEMPETYRDVFTKLVEISVIDDASGKTTSCSHYGSHRQCMTGSIMNARAEFVPVTIDKSHIITIGERLYTESIEFVRKLVNNAFDADATGPGSRRDPRRLSPHHE
jgi:hypothetical protein